MKKGELATDRLEIKGSSVLQPVPCPLVRQCVLSGQQASKPEKTINSWAHPAAFPAEEGENKKKKKNAFLSSNQLLISLKSCRYLLLDTY